MRGPFLLLSILCLTALQACSNSIDGAAPGRGPATSIQGPPSWAAGKAPAESAAGAAAPQAELAELSPPTALTLPPSQDQRLPPPLAPGRDSNGPATIEPTPTGESPPSPSSWTLTQEEVSAVYAGVSYTYAFDACGLPLLGEESRQDIANRIAKCPNTAERKEQLQTIYQRAIDNAERDIAKTRAAAEKFCPDKAAFLRNVMAHADELRFDPVKPDCRALSPAAPGPTAADPRAPDATPPDAPN